MLLKAVTNTIDDYSMVKKKDRILVAVSGGADSISLVLLLLALKARYTIKIGIAHLNHMVRGEESLRDESFVKQFAKNLNLPFFCRQINVKDYAKSKGLSFEQAGRDLRYEYFMQLAHEHGYTKIATGHNKEDNAELVLMNLLRGSGPKGLCGIPPIRDNIYIRPLIRISKTKILDFLKLNNQDYMFDSSNNDTIYLRNRIRHQLLPHLESQFNREIIDALDRLSNILKLDEDYLEQQTMKKYNKCLLHADISSVSLSKKQLSKLHPGILNRVLRNAVKTVKNNLNQITQGHINDIVQFSFNTLFGTSLDLPGRIRVYKQKGIIILKKETKPLREIGRLEKQLQNKHKKRGEVNQQP